MKTYIKQVFVFLCLLLSSTISTYAAEKIILGLSQNQVSITPGFAGTEIIVYGAISNTDNSHLQPVSDEKFDIIVTLSSMPKGVTVRKKTKVANIWTNTQSIDRVFAPEYYTIASSRPVKNIIPSAQDKLYNISIENIIYVPNHTDYAHVDKNSFVQALIRLRRKSGLYRQASAGVTITSDTLFQARLQMPENIISGDYRVRAFLIRQQKVQDVLVSDIYVRKAGIERILYELAYDKPLQYGLLSILTAVVFGWLAYQIFSIRRS